MSNILNSGAAQTEAAHIRKDADALFKFLLHAAEIWCQGHCEDQNAKILTCLAQDSMKSAFAEVRADLPAS